MCLLLSHITESISTVIPTSTTTWSVIVILECFLYSFQSLAFGHTDTMEQRHDNASFNPLLLQQLQQAQMTPLNNVPRMQSPFQQQGYNPPQGVNNMTWSSYATGPHYIQSAPAIRMTPGVIVTATPTFPTTPDTTMTTFHDQYGSSSQQRPFYGVWNHPTCRATLPPPSLQVSCDPKLTIYINLCVATGNRSSLIIISKC